MKIVPSFRNSSLNQPSSADTVDVSEWHRALEAVGESEERFRTLADCAPVVVWMTDVECRCTHISTYWRQFTGRDPGRDLGFGWVEALHPDDRDRAARDLVEAGKLRSRGRSA